MASIRLRLISPMSYLRGRGLEVETYRSQIGPAGYAAIIFSKSFSREAIDIARAARSLGRPVVFDICDNLLAGKARVDKQERIARVKEMMGLATHITFSTPTLAAQFQAELPQIAPISRVIPDVVEQLDERTPDRPTAGGERTLHALKRFLARHDDALHCVWFGKSQGRLSGFVHLDRAIGELETFAQSHPVTLTVISNSRWRYWTSSRRWRVPTHYAPWSLDTFDKALGLHDVAIVPVQKNGYTMGKTINRPATAIAAGLGVIADAIDSYEELRPFIPLDDWQGGLHRYHAVPPRTDPDLEAARAHLRRCYGPEAVGACWQRLLEEAVAGV